MLITWPLDTLESKDLVKIVVWTLKDGKDTSKIIKVEPWWSVKFTLILIILG